MTKRTRKKTAAKGTSSPLVPSPTRRRRTPQKSARTSGNEGHNYVGKRIARVFDDEIYHGTIDTYHPRRRLWSIKYDDGDAEELDHREVLLAIDLAEGNTELSYVDKRVSRKFGRKVYHGTVDKFDRRARLWHITFDDGDEEELEHEELLFALDLHDSIQMAEKTEGNEKQDKDVQSNNETSSSINEKEEDSEENSISTTTNTKKNHTSTSFSIPLIVAILASIIWICKNILTANAVEQETLLRSTGLLKFQPDKFQGGSKKKQYFEGWYYKFVSPLNNNESDDGDVMSMAVVPGIFHGATQNSNESHAFIFVTINGERQHYYRFDTKEFTYASAKGSDEYYIQVADNKFTHSGVSLSLFPKENDDATLVLEGKLDFLNPSPWPVSVTKLGAMGPVGWIPGLECTHAILSFDHVLRGSLTLSFDAGDSSEEEEASLPSTVVFDNGRGYTEKDFGRSFPSLWLWIQTNSFRKTPGTSLFVSIARLPLFGLELPGFTAAVWHNSTLIPFATWTGAKFDDLRISEDEVYIAMRSSRLQRSNGYRLEITVDRRNVPEVLLYAPVNFTKMEPFVLEALQAKVHMRLSDGNGDVLVEDTGEYAGLEVHGDVRWLVDNVCGKETAKKVCL